MLYENIKSINSSQSKNRTSFNEIQKNRKSLNYSADGALSAELIVCARNHILGPLT